MTTMMTLAPWAMLRAAQEGAEGAVDSVSGFMHWVELGATILLVVGTFLLWYVTLQVHRDEVNKMGDHLSHANDNMTDVALAEIDSHQDNRTRMQRVLRIRNTMRRNQAAAAKEASRGDG